MTKIFLQGLFFSLCSGKDNTIDVFDTVEDVVPLFNLSWDDNSIVMRKNDGQIVIPRVILSFTEQDIRIEPCPCGCHYCFSNGGMEAIYVPRAMIFSLSPGQVITADDGWQSISPLFFHLFSAYQFMN